MNTDLLNLSLSSFNPIIKYKSGYNKNLLFLLSESVNQKLYNSSLVSDSCFNSENEMVNKQIHTQDFRYKRFFLLVYNQVKESIQTTKG